MDARAHALLAAARETPGFLPEDEALGLFHAGRVAARARLGPLAEVGSYLGRSALFLAAAIAAEGASTVLFSIDHHRGSEEMQAGWPHHDPALVDRETGRMDSFGSFRRSLEDAGATDLVIAIVGDSTLVGSHLELRCSLVFLDGGHGSEIAWADYRVWSERVAPGGLLVIHDVFEDPADGGRPPFECFADALASGRFREETGASVRSLRVLRRLR